MRRFRRWPPSIRTVLARIAIATAWDHDARELNPNGGCAKRDIIGMIRRQSGISYRPGDPKTAKDLHRTGRHVIAFDAWHLARGIALRDHDIDAARREVKRER
jgi:hypothetical protein